MLSHLVVTAIFVGTKGNEGDSASVTNVSNSFHGDVTQANSAVDKNMELRYCGANDCPVGNINISVI